jgi:hypothetical protein
MFGFKLPSKAAIKSTGIAAVKVAGVTAVAVGTAYGIFKVAKRYAPAATEAVGDAVDTAFDTPVVGG